MIPLDVATLVKEENQKLAKEIEDQRNEKFVTELKKLYTDRWKAYKDEFYTPDRVDKATSVRCLAYTIYHSDLGLLRRVLLADCYA
jgi:hypothetical protein